MWKVCMGIGLVCILCGCETVPTEESFPRTTIPDDIAIQPGEQDVIDIVQPGGDVSFVEAGSIALPPEIAAASRTALRDIHFAYDSAEIMPDEAAILQGVAGFLSQYPTVLLQVQGHCDERGTEEYNMALGSRRAGGVRQFLMDLQIDPNRLYIISYGEEQPLDPGTDEAARTKNRRVHFLVGLTQ